MVLLKHEKIKVYKNPDFYLICSHIINGYLYNKVMTNEV